MSLKAEQERWFGLADRVVGSVEKYIDARTEESVERRRADKAREEMITEAMKLLPVVLERLYPSGGPAPEQAS